MQPDQPTHDISLPRRNLRDCLAEELRRLDPTTCTVEVIPKGLAARGPADAGDARRSDDERTQGDRARRQATLSPAAVAARFVTRRSTSSMSSARRRHRAHRRHDGHRRARSDQRVARQGHASTGRSSTSGGATSAGFPPAIPNATRRRRVRRCSISATGPGASASTSPASDDGLDLDAAADAYAAELARTRRAARASLVRHHLPRRRAGRSRRVAVPRTGRHPGASSARSSPCATPRSRHPSA